MSQCASLWVFPCLGIPGSGPCCGDLDPAVGHGARDRVCCEIMSPPLHSSSLLQCGCSLTCPMWRCHSDGFCIFFRGSCPICSLHSVCLWEEASSASSWTRSASSSTLKDLWLDCAYLVHLGLSPHPKGLWYAPCRSAKETYWQRLRIRTWTSLGGHHYSAYHPG